MTGDTYDVRSSEIFEKLEWILIEKTLKNCEIMMTFKTLTARSSNNITELFSKCVNENCNWCWNNTKLSLTKQNKTFLKTSFSYRAAKSGNELSDEIKNNFDTLSLVSFKRGLSRVLFLNIYLDKFMLVYT